MGINFETIQKRIIEERNKVVAKGKNNTSASRLNMHKMLESAVSANYDITSYFILTDFKLGNSRGGSLSSFASNSDTSLKEIDVWKYMSDIMGQNTSDLNSIINQFQSGDIVGGISSVASNISSILKGLPGPGKGKRLGENKPKDQADRKHFKEVPPDPMLCSPLLIQSVDVSNLTTSKIREWDGNQWTYTTGRPELATITITMRDFGGGICFRLFHDWFLRSATLYPSDQYSTISVARLDLNNLVRASQAPKIQQEDAGYIRFNPIIFTNKAVLVDVSPPQFSSNEELSVFRLTFDFDPFYPIQ